MELKGVVAASQPRWIPVTERLPEAGMWVLVWKTEFGYDVDMLREDGTWALTRDTISHWASLLEPPKEVDHES